MGVLVSLDIMDALQSKQKTTTLGTSTSTVAARGAWFTGEPGCDSMRELCDSMTEPCGSMVEPSGLMPTDCIREEAMTEDAGGSAGLPMSRATVGTFEGSMPWILEKA
mmetsp:Transcript_82506/g.207622  ORF Transcript_82506/g.207622 Transcript_82506/m.207622 type:complete len:108 (-) Transcript_82506:4956-5279(-)